MASRLVRGDGGKIVCPFCGREATYELEEVRNEYGTDLVPLAENLCNHLDDAEWEVMADGSVEVVAFNADEDE
jgi:uncharacterized Zn finger protein (UPF0148 family)